MFIGQVLTMCLLALLIPPCLVRIFSHARHSRLLICCAFWLKTLVSAFCLLSSFEFVVVQLYCCAFFILVIFFAVFLKHSAVLKYLSINLDLASARAIWHAPPKCVSSLRLGIPGSFFFFRPPYAAISVPVVLRSALNLHAGQSNCFCLASWTAHYL
jgi:hypothetical protein